MYPLLRLSIEKKESPLTWAYIEEISEIFLKSDSNNYIYFWYGVSPGLPETAWND
jgi:hypothetical protein